MNRKIQTFNDDYSIKVVQDLEEFRKLKDTWNSLAESSQSYTPWLSWDWFNLCLKYSGNWNKLIVLVVYKAAEIVAIVPFVLKKETYKGIFRTNKIELLGCSYSPAGDVLFGDVNQDVKKSILSTIIHYFRDHYRNWTIIELDKVIGKNSFSELFGDVIANSGLKYRTFFCFNNWYSDGIDYNFGQFFGNLPKNLHRNVQRYEKKIKSIGELRFEMETDDEEIDHFLNLYDQIRGKSWKAIEKDMAFYRDFLRYAAQKGWIRLSFLYIGEIPIAAAKYLVWNKTAFGMDAVYDQSYSKYSPGAILTSKLLQYVVDTDKVTQIDLGRGDEPYKMEWVSDKREIRGITIFNRTPGGQFLAFLITKALPIVEKNRNLLNIKNRLLGFVKKCRKG